MDKRIAALLILSLFVLQVVLVFSTAGTIPAIPDGTCRIQLISTNDILTGNSRDVTVQLLAMTGALVGYLLLPFASLLIYWLLLRLRSLNLLAKVGAIIILSVISGALTFAADPTHATATFWQEALIVGGEVLVADAVISLLVNKLHLNFSLFVKLVSWILVIAAVFCLVLQSKYGYVGAGCA